MDPNTNPMPSEQPQQTPVPNSQPQPVAPAPVTMPGAAPQPSAPVAPQSDPGQGFGIASLILAIFGVWPIGLILGFIGRSKSKSIGKSNGLALAGIIISSISMVLFFLWLVLFVILGVLDANGSKAETSSLNNYNYSSIEDNGGGASAASTASTTPASGKCLTESMFASYELTGINGDMNAALALFNPDATTYASQPLDEDGMFFATNTLEKYNKYKDYDFNILLTGGVQQGSNTAAAKQLALDRATKVQNELISRGIPASRIVINDNTQDSSNNDVLASVPEWNREVVIDFTLDCN